MALFFRRNHARPLGEPEAEEPVVHEPEVRRYPGTWRLSLTSFGPEDTPWPRIVYSTALGVIRSLVDSSPRLLVLGIAWYGLLAISYDRFYSSLGVTPGDVGLSYTTILASSVGAAVSVIAYVLFAIALLGSLLWLAKRRRDQRLVRAIKRNTPSFMLWVTVLIAVLIGLVLLPVAANNQVKALRKGCNVSSPRLPGLPVSVLSINASRVEMPIGPLASTSLAKGDLFYLGQANGTLVFYREGVPIYTPSRNATLNYLPDRGQCRH